MEEKKHNIKLPVYHPVCLYYKQVEKEKILQPTITTIIFMILFVHVSYMKYIYIQQLYLNIYIYILITYIVVLSVCCLSPYPINYYRYFLYSGCFSQTNKQAKNRGKTKKSQDEY